MKVDLKWLGLLTIGFFFVISGCSSTTTMSDVQDDDEPPWISGDAASGDNSGRYLYFVGRNAVVDASPRRPSRSAFMSAENDAKRQYVEYMETLVQSKTNEALASAGDNMEGSQSVSSLKSLIKTFSQKTVKGVKKHDHYYISTDRNKSDIPLWTVWVRVKIDKDIVRQKFDLLSNNIQKKATQGVKSAKEMVKAVQAVQKEIKKDDFFDGF